MSKSEMMNLLSFRHTLKKKREKREIKITKKIKINLNFKN